MSSNTIISFRPANVIRRLPWRLDSQAASGFLLILGTFGLVGWLYLTQASAVTATSYRIDELRLELDHLKNQNAALSLEIAELEALPRIEQRARALGFQPTTNVRYLPVANYPASKDEETAAGSGISYGREPVDMYAAEPDPSAWWVRMLDDFAVWLEGRSVNRY
jgi:hypothetical protein